MNKEKYIAIVGENRRGEKEKRFIVFTYNENSKLSNEHILDSISSLLYLYVKDVRGEQIGFIDNKVDKMYIRWNILFDDSIELFQNEKENISFISYEEMLKISDVDEVMDYFEEVGIR